MCLKWKMYIIYSVKNKIKSSECKLREEVHYVNAQFNNCHVHIVKIQWWLSVHLLIFMLVFYSTLVFYAQYKNWWLISIPVWIKYLHNDIIPIYYPALYHQDSSNWQLFPLSLNKLLEAFQCRFVCQQDQPSVATLLQLETRSSSYGSQCF